MIRRALSLTLTLLLALVLLVLVASSHGARLPRGAGPYVYPPQAILAAQRTIAGGLRRLLPAARSTVTCHGEQPGSYATLDGYHLIVCHLTIRLPAATYEQTQTFWLDTRLESHETTSGQHVTTPDRLT